MTNDKQTLGAYGERIAATYLSEHGLRVIDHNWRCPGSKEERAGKTLGELDLVAWDSGGILVIIEVKTRSGDGFGTPAQAVSTAKYRRLRRLGAMWVSENGVRPKEIRIDVVSVLVHARSSHVEVEHTIGAFR